jgi:exonuclease SbcC
MGIARYLPDDLETEELRIVEAPGMLYEIEYERGAFGNELLLIRYLSQEDDAQELVKSDVDKLESRFYDNDTPNQWNIRLIWAHEEGGAPDSEIRNKLENDTRFAIRRCIHVDALADFVTPLSSARKKLRRITTRFDRSELIENIIDQDLEFFFQDLTRDEKFERLESGVTPTPMSVSPSTASSASLDSFIDTTHLGDFREHAHLDELDAKPFTLLYGRNGTGKTSLLDGTALGLIGHIRHDDGRADDYDGLHVTLEGDSEPLPTDSASINDRVANWFGFRPHGSANKHIEFYRVNYHEAGAATRFIENDPDINIDQTLRRLLFGEELEDARRDKEELLPRLSQAIKEKEEQLEELQSENQELRDNHERVVNVFSRLSIATENLSPAARAVLAGDSHSPDLESDLSPDPNDLKQWAKWEQRFVTLEDGLNAVSESVSRSTGSTTPGKLRKQLLEADEHVQRVINDIKRIRDRQTERAQLTELRNDLRQANLRQVPASIGFIALVLASNEATTADLRMLQTVLETEVPAENHFGDATSIGEWRTRTRSKIGEQLERLSDQKEKIEKFDELEKERRKLLTDIRKDTEEYLSITDNIYCCPACYIEQDRDTILNRDKPEQLHGDGPQGVPDTLLDRISKLEQAREFLNAPLWEDIEHDLSVRFDDLYEMTAFQDLWDSDGAAGNVSTIVSEVSPDAVDTFATAFRETNDVDLKAISFEQAIDSGLDAFDKSISEWIDPLPKQVDPKTDVKQLEKSYRSRADDIRASLDILEDHWLDDARNQQLDVENDALILRRALEEVEDNPSVLAVPSEYKDQLSENSSRIDTLRKSIDNCRDSIERLKAAFEGDGGETELEGLVADHMAVISTLFKIFQRPYEFEQARYQDGEIIVQRRNADGKANVSEMSSGQRAALALSIFVTNNIAHERAPPVMLLDEPFAHLDDINTISFFNLLLELAETDERQIMFATANKDIAELLQRKVGESQDFSRIDIPATGLMSDSE